MSPKFKLTKDQIDMIEGSAISIFERIELESSLERVVVSMLNEGAVEEDVHAYIHYKMHEIFAKIQK